MLGSIAAIGSAFVGTKVYPIQKGGDPLVGPALLGATITGAFAAAKEAIEPKPEPLATETVPIDQLKDNFAKKFKQMYPNWSDDMIDKAANVADLITKKLTKEKPIEKMNSYELENFRNKLNNELNKENILGKDIIADVAISRAVNEKPEEEIKPSVVEDEKSKVVFEKNPIGGNVRTYTPENDEHDKVVYVEKAPLDFFNQQLEFYKSLSDEDKKILKSYTKKGDGIINSISRNTYTETQLLEEISKMNDEAYDIPLLFGVEFKDITSTNVENVSKEYVTKFKTVFDKVPSVTSEFKVFRGTQEPTPNFNGFISTTYDPMSGRLYDVFTGPSCCVYELTVMPGTKALWLEPISEFSGEQEVLLNDSSKVTITKETTKEVWKLLTKNSSLNKLSKTVYEGTVQVLEGAPSSEETISGGKRKVPFWFKHSGKKH